MSSQRKAPGVAATASGATGSILETGAAPESNPTAIMADKARERTARAITWRMRNWEAWEYIVGLATEKARTGTPFGMQELVERVRRRNFIDNKGRTTRVDNTIVPALARILIGLHSECAPYIEQRTCAYDGLHSHDELK
ncbi:hypothetical protein [Olsenella uli]|uniref:hypothetical protein n=1 Tax=Olsenella uli TaxID=133926 RepID=UPI00241F0B37|nr:hypothetical protein [Olsenella uli]